jgi:hypothetical protein
MHVNIKACFFFIRAAKPVQGALKLDVYLDNSAKNTFLQR